MFSLFVARSREDVLNAVSEGASVDARNSDQHTPLNRACSYGHLEVAMALIEVGAVKTNISLLIIITLNNIINNNDPKNISYTIVKC